MKKKIVLFIPSIEGGGVEKNLFLIAGYLSKIHKKLFIITADKKYKNSFNKKISVICPTSNIWERKTRLVKTIISTLLLIKSFNKDIIILSFQSNIVAIFVSKIFGYKIIIRLNTSIKKYINNIFKKFLYKLFYNFADEIIVNSNNFKKEIKKILNLNSNLIYNLNKVNKKRKKINFFKNFKGLKILNIARLTDQKDHITLLKSLKLLSKKNIKYKCCIIGRGYNKNYLEHYIKKNKLQKNIKILGYKEDAEKYLNSCNLFILTSKFEGLPNVLIEAQYRNIPIISSDCPTGPREILMNGKLGELFNVGDYKGLCTKILEYTNNRKKLNKRSYKAKRFLYRFNPILNGEKYNRLISYYLNEKL
mgnify:CR=1 FL=1